MSTYPETLNDPTVNTSGSSAGLAHAVVHAAAEELNDCFRMLKHCVSQLSEDQLWHRPTSHQNAIGNLLLHLQGNLQQWIVCGLSDQTDIRHRPSEFSITQGPNSSELMQSLQSCVHRANDLLRSLSDIDLLRSRRIQGFEMQGMAALQHAVSHFRGHTQEIIGRTRLLLDDTYQFAWIPRGKDQGAEE
jgi:hypothetical protein